MRLFLEAPLQEGVWLVKWVDRLTIRQGASAVGVDVILEKVADDPDASSALIDGTASVPLGRRQDQQTGAIVVSRVLAGYMPIFALGDLIVGGEPIGHIADQHRRVTIRPGNSVRKIDDPSTPPFGWKAGRFKTLNRFEYALGSDEFNGSECLVFEDDGCEYLLPRSVIFTSFYGLHTRLVDALLRGPWPIGVREVLSFDRFESGIVTAVDEQSGTWNVVLEIGIPVDLAAPLALLWHDEYARSKAAAIYTTGLLQGGKGFITADIPHRIAPEGFEMTVRGQQFPKFGGKRFLVTSIAGYQWTPGKRPIRWELSNSNRSGESVTEGDGQSYGRFKPTVDGLEHAEAASALPADAASSLNVFEAKTISFWPEPNLALQPKRSSKSGSSATPLPSEQSPIVSAGVKTYRPTAAAPAAIEQPIRGSSKQFDALHASLDQLRSLGAIDRFSIIDAPGDLQVSRGAWPCWSLVGYRQPIKRRSWHAMIEGESATARVSARSALVIEVVTAEATCVLLEIETRPAESTGYCLYAWRGPADRDVIRTVASQVSRRKGRLTPSDKSNLAPHEIVAINHRYIRDSSGAMLGMDAAFVRSAVMRASGA